VIGLPWALAALAGTAEIAELDFQPACGGTSQPVAQPPCPMWAGGLEVATMAKMSRPRACVVSDCKAACDEPSSRTFFRKAWACCSTVRDERGLVVVKGFRVVLKDCLDSSGI
jgi:hypothetical protein